MGKFDAFESWVMSIMPDVIGVTESWANSSILDSELSLPGYDLVRHDRLVDRVGGGVLLYIRSELNAMEYVPETDFPEQVWCQLSSVRNDKFLIGVCYRTPSIDIFSYDIHGKLRQLLNEIGNSHKH